MYRYICEWKEQFRNMTEMKPKHFKLVSKNTRHCSSILYICMDKNVLMKVQLEKVAPFARGEFFAILYVRCIMMTKCAVLNFS